MSHPVIHFEFGTPDGSALAEFYHRLFGWEVQPSGPEYWLLAPGEEGIAGGVLQTTGGIPPYFTVYVAVDDLGVALSDAEKLGASRIVEPTTVPGVGSFAMIRDPAGNMIGLMRQGETAGR
jgi:predicted enzyme related to lactoylglutathione lyase